MDKAIEILKRINTQLNNKFSNGDRLSDHEYKLMGDSKQAVAELIFYKAKIEELKEWCESQKKTWTAQTNGDEKVYDAMLQKLKELDNE